MNIVGTPYSAVQRSSCTACSVVTGSNAGAGNTTAAPWLNAPSTPITMPKQWYIGTGMHSRSSWPTSITSVTKYPLLRMLWCDSVAPLGKPVVPEVYWMLIGSSKDSVTNCSSSRTWSAAPPATSSASHSAAPMNTTSASSGQSGRTCSIIAR